MINSILLVAYFNHNQEVWDRNKVAFFGWVYSLFFFINKKWNVWESTLNIVAQKIDVFLQKKIWKAKQSVSFNISTPFMCTQWLIVDLLKMWYPKKCSIILN